MKITISFCILAVSLFVSACATKPPPGNAVTISVSNGGRITLHGKDVSLNNLTKEMKGCNRSTRIRIEIPADASAGFIKAITKELASANYRRVIFARPKKSIAIVDNNL